MSRRSVPQAARAARFVACIAIGCWLLIVAATPAGIGASALPPPAAAGTTLIGEAFSAAATAPNAWFVTGAACLTAGTVTTPATSLPACGVNAATDGIGQGALQLTKSASYQSAMIVNRTPLSTAGGLQITFTDYSFNGSAGADGITLFLSDASRPYPTVSGQPGGSLGYANANGRPGLANAFLGIGLDEFGNFSSASEQRRGGPGRIPETIALRGAASAGYPYLGGVTAGGVAASLPFRFDQPAQSARPSAAPTVRITLTTAGAFTAAIDIHDGRGFVTYLTTKIVGIAGQPPVPAAVFVGVTASSGHYFDRHQIGGLAVTALGTQAGTPHTPVTSLPEPAQLISQNGALVFNVSAETDPATGNPQLSYNGSRVAPTLRLLPGDTLIVSVTNHLSAPPAGAAYLNDVSLHYHGLHVTPNAPGDDSIDMIAAPGQTLHYQLHLPVNHPPGLYWYHSHAHGETERQTLAGMSGAIVVDGIAQYIPQVANLPEQILILRDAPLPGQPLANANALQSKAMRWAMLHGAAIGPAGVRMPGLRDMHAMNVEVRAATTAAARNPFVLVNPTFRTFSRPQATSTHCTGAEAPVKALTVNGQIRPSIAIRPGEQQFWRLVNAGADTYLDVQVDNAQLHIVAIDGVPVITSIGSPGILTVNDYVLPPSSRVEFMVTGPASGAPAYLRTACVDAGQSGSAMPATILATLDPNATAPAATLPSRIARRSTASHAAPLYGARRIAAQPIARRQTLYYSDQNTIDGVAYDPGAPPMFYAQSGTIEEWTIVNNAAQVHTFHIHQIHFVVEAIDGATPAQQLVMDNVNVPAATAAGPGTVKLLLDFTDPLDVGTFLLHCHILSHEDGGMMAKIRIGTAPPLVVSPANVSFSGTGAAPQVVTLAGGSAPFSVNGCAQVAKASVRNNAVTIAPSGAGACVLAVSDSSGLTGTIAVNVAGVVSPVVAAPNTLSLVTGAAGAAVALRGGKLPYTAAGCAGTAAATVSSANVVVTPLAVGACTLTLTDAAANAASVAVSVNAPVTGAAPLDNLTFHHDAMRTGWYNAETALTPAIVGSNRFGLLGTLTAPAGSPPFGKVYAQPLFVSGETVADGSTHNLVVIATSSDQIYAYDERSRAVVWHRDFTNPGAQIRPQSWTDSGCSDINPTVGITGTPVIDRSRDTLYVVVATNEAGNFHLRLHAISLKSGREATTPGGVQVGPTEVTATYALASGGAASVSALNNLQRSALLEANGNIYVALASHCDYHSGSTHGWMLAYGAGTLAPTGNMLDLTDLNTGSAYFLGSPWMGGYGPGSDAQGNIYFATGNGPFNGVTNFSMSVLRLPGTLDITKVRYFSPAGGDADGNQDADLGSGGVMLLPDLPGPFPHVLVAGGKCGAGAAAGGTAGCVKYLLDRDALGGRVRGDTGALWKADTGGGIWGGPASFVGPNGTNYVVYGTGNPLSTYAVSTAPLRLSVQSSAYVGCLECRDSGSQPIVSSNGTLAATAVVWALKTPGNSGGTISLYAFDALNMGRPLFAAPAGAWTQAAGTSWIGGALISPTVVDGNVYVPVDGAVAVFGVR